MQKAYIPLLVLFLFASCTLSMDEEMPVNKQSIEELENVGFDEPYTQETEYGDITFQYSDSTQLLRQAALDYLAKVEADTILYFTDNIPQDLLLRPGRYVSAPCSHELPTGLCNYVESLTHDAGMYKVVTSRATMEQVFDELDVSLNIDYILTHDIEMPDSEECVAMGIDPSCPTVTDFDILDGISTPAKTRAMRLQHEKAMAADIAYSKTRGLCYGDKDDGMEVWTDGESGDIDDKKDKNNSYKAELFKFDSSKIGDLYDYLGSTSALCSAFKELGDAGIGIEFTVSEFVDKNVTVDIKLDKKNPKNTTRKETIIDQSHYNLTYSVSEKGTPFDLEKFYTKHKDKMEKLLATSRINKDAWKEDRSFKIDIPFPSMPALCLYLMVTPKLEIEVGFMGKVSMNIYKPSTTTTVYSVGKEIKKKEVSKPTGSRYVTWDPIEAEGSLSITGGIAGYLGVSLGLTGGGKKATLLGLGVGGSLNANATFTFDTSVGKGEHGLEFSSKTKIDYSIYFQPEFQLILLGFELGPLPFGTKLNIAEGTLDLTPAFGKTKGCFYNLVEDDGHGNTYIDFTGQYSYSEIGLEARANPKRFKPTLALYYFDSWRKFRSIDDDDKSYVMMDLKNYSGELVKNTTYQFTYKSDKKLGKYYYMVPGYTKDGGKPQMIYDKKIEVDDQAYATMKNAGTYLEKIEKNVGGCKYKYNLLTKVKMINTNLVKSQWDEMGLYIASLKFRRFIDEEKTKYEWRDYELEHHYHIAKPGLENGDGIYYFRYSYSTNYDEHIQININPYYKTKGTEHWYGDTEGVIIPATSIDGLKNEYEIVELYPDRKPNFKKSDEVAGGATAGRTGSHD